MSTTYYVWDEENDSLLEEIDENGNVIVSYTNEPGQFGKVISQERDGVTSYYHYDGQGNTVALTDDNENITDTYVYSAFGELVSSTGTTVNPFRYGGQYGYYTDVETNDIYVRARSYNPSLGRWLTRDPMEFEGSEWNLYEFLQSKVLESVDPSGMIKVRTVPCPPTVIAGCKTFCGVRPSAPACSEIDCGPISVFVKACNCGPCPACPAVPAPVISTTHDHANCLKRTGSMTHWHYFRYDQNPTTCFCRLSRIFGDCGTPGTPTIPIIPIVPPVMPGGNPPVIIIPGHGPIGNPTIT